MSFKLIARDNKINIYDPYSDKYHVVEDDDELNKLIDSDGKLISDEQLRQYFATKESKSRKIQKGFVTRKANLKKEYADVEKQTFKDIVKSKLYSTYGDILSNEDINAFNKNPSIATIKSFKSINKDIKNDMQNLFKSNEITFNQDFQDKNNFASVLSELQSMNSTYIDNIYNLKNLAYMTMKKDVETLKTALNDGDEETANKMVQNIKNTVVSTPSVDSKIIQLVNEVKDKPDELLKVVDAEMVKNENKSKQLDATKYIFKADDITMNGEYSPGKNGFEQFNKAVTIKKFNMEPLKTLYKNLSFINNPEVISTKPTIDIADNEDNTTSYHINFGKNGKIKFDYTINNDTPYFDRMKPVIAKLQDDVAKTQIDDYQKDFQSLKDSIITVDAGDYTKTHSNDVTQNSYKFTNPYKPPVEYNELYSTLDDIPGEDDLDYKMVMQIKSPMFNPDDFEKYVAALETADWFKTNNPQIKFDKKLEHHAFNETVLDKDMYENPFIHAISIDEKSYPKRHMYKDSVKSTINKDIDDKVNFIIQTHNENSENEWSDDEAKMLANIIKGYVYQQGMNYDSNELEDLKQNPLAKQDSTEFDKKYSFPVPLTGSILEDIKSLRDGEMYKKPTSKSKEYVLKNDYIKFMKSINDDVTDKNTILGSINAITRKMFNNLDNAYYWYYKDTTANKPFELYVPGKTKDVSRIRPLDPSVNGVHSKATPLEYNHDAINKYNPINTIESNIYIPYGRKYLSEEDFQANGFCNGKLNKHVLNKRLRDMLILKLNSVN